MNRVAEVNRELEAEGREERLRRGHGYYYFSGGTANRWGGEQGVYVNRADALTVEEWMQEFRQRLSDWIEE